MKKELVIKRCSKCQSLVEVLKDCTSDNYSIKCCGEEMIEWIAMLANNKIIKKFLLPGEEACVIFPYVKGSKIYSFCNKHGLWSKEVE